MIDAMLRVVSVLGAALLVAAVASAATPQIPSFPAAGTKLCEAVMKSTSDCETPADAVTYAINAGAAAAAPTGFTANVDYDFYASAAVARANGLYQSQPGAVKRGTVPGLPDLSGVFVVTRAGVAEASVLVGNVGIDVVVQPAAQTSHPPAPPIAFAESLARAVADRVAAAERSIA